jgi:hypothetical protein
MPVVNGVQATEIIREFELSLPTPKNISSAPPITEESATQLSPSPMSPPPTNLPASRGLSSEDYFTLPLSPPNSDVASQYNSLAPLSASSSKKEPADRAQITGRVPIFAVSASLNQHTQESLSAAGFDGWLSKPIDFKRLGVVLEGVGSREARIQAKSAPGDFKRGGWFD